MVVNPPATSGRRHTGYATAKQGNNKKEGISTPAKAVAACDQRDWATFSCYLLPNKARVLVLIHELAHRLIFIF